MKDSQGVEIEIGCFVKLLEAQSFWFEHEPKESYEILQSACAGPVEVTDMYDGKVVVDLPATKDHEGELVGSSITTAPEKVKVVKC